jgi:UPF0755 protein
MAKKSFFRRTVVVLILLVGALGIAGISILKGSCVDEPVEIFIHKNTPYSALLDSLEQNGVKKMGLISLVGKYEELEHSIKPGHYVLGKGANAVGIVRLFKSGAQKPVKLVINNVRTLEQLAAKLSSQLEADSATLYAHLSNPETAKKYGLKREELIGIFLPNTYEVWWTATPEAITDRMNREWNNFWNESRTAKLKRIGLSKMEVVTLASIIYEETKNVTEMPKIAGVYVNRLRRGIPLQACPTAKYAVGDFTLRRVLNKHIQFESPYNTYLNKGLTPGPICIPSLATIDATLNYVEHNYLFFCAKEDFSGTHNFAATNAEHSANARRYQEALNKRGIK